MHDDPNVAGLAALAICESLILSLNDKNLIDDDEALAILRDAATTHHDAAALGTDGTGHKHASAAILIERIIAGGNSVRRPPEGTA